MNPHLLDTLGNQEGGEGKWIQDIINASLIEEVSERGIGLPVLKMTLNRSYYSTSFRGRF